MTVLLTLILVAALLLQGTLTSVPLVLVTLLCLIIVRPDSYAFAAAFVAGIFLDVFALRQVGITSIFLLFFVFLILLYQRKYEIHSYPFVLAASFIGSLVFLSVFGYANVLGHAALSVIAAFFLFACIKLFIRIENKRNAKTLHYTA